MFNVTIHIDEDIQEKWLQWMHEKCLEFALLTSSSYKMLKPIDTEQIGGVTYSFQFIFGKDISLHEYQKKYEAHIGTHMYSLFANKFAEFRTLLEILKEM
jgi:hypothetical protein